MNCNNIHEQVHRFNYLFGVISNEYYPLQESININLFDINSIEFNKSQFILRYKLINEEIEETINAINNDDIIEIIDGLCDMLYVLFGAIVYFNLPITYINNQLIKIGNLNELDNLIDDNYILKVKNNLNFKEIIKSISKDNQLLSELTTKILEDNNYYDNYIYNYESLINNIVLNVYKISELLNININYFFNIVHNSNMSKICVSEDEANKTIKWYRNNEHRYKNPSYRETSYNGLKYYIIYDKDTGKILKSINYEKVIFK